MKRDDQAVLEHAEMLLRERGFLGAATGCEALRRELHQDAVDALAGLILQAQRSVLSEMNS